MPPSIDTFENMMQDGLYPNFYSLLICQQDTLIYEKYFSGYHAGSMFDIRSSFKSILSLLVGIASDLGHLQSLDDKLFKYFADTSYGCYFDDQKKTISIRDLLSMKSGLICEEFFSSHDCETPMEETDEWVAFCIQRPMAHSPGAHWSYSTCNALIAGALIEYATGKTIASFADEQLFIPLGIKDYQWTRDPSGNYMSGGSFYMTAADMLKIGQLVRHEGYYANRRIVSGEYIQLATSPITPIPSFSFVAQSGLKHARYKPTYYGLCWYTESVKVGKHYYTCQFSSGNGGQYILIIKELKLVIASTQGNFDSARAKQFFEILIRHIIPTVLRK